MFYFEASLPLKRHFWPATLLRLSKNTHDCRVETSACSLVVKTCFHNITLNLNVPLLNPSTV